MASSARSFGSNSFARPAAPARAFSDPPLRSAFVGLLEDFFFVAMTLLSLAFILQTRKLVSPAISFFSSLTLRPPAHSPPGRSARSLPPPSNGCIPQERSAHQDPERLSFPFPP